MSGQKNIAELLSEHALETKFEDLSENNIRICKDKLLDNIVEEIAYFFVSICLIPIVVLVLLVVLMKSLLGFKSSGSGDYNALLKEVKKISSGKNDQTEA